LPLLKFQPSYLTEQNYNLGHLFDETLDLHYTYDFKVFYKVFALNLSWTYTCYVVRIWRLQSLSYV